MDIIDKANELGKLIESSEEYTTFRAAETKFLNDKNLQSEIHDYKKIFDEYRKTSNKDLEDAIDTKYNQLLSNQIYADYINFKNRYENMMSSVNELVNRYVGYNKKSCSSGCGGCSKKK